MSHYVCYRLSLFGNFEERDMQENNVLFLGHVVDCTC